jgi:hypothetical protein
MARLELLLGVGIALLAGVLISALDLAIIYLNTRP